MKKTILLTIILFTIVSVSHAIVPKYYGARSLALGYSGTALSFDLNMLFINPSFLSSVSFNLSGYQYQQSYRSYLDFYDKLNEVLSYDLKNFESLSSVQKSSAWTAIQDLFNRSGGLYGFKSSVPGHISRGYGLVISFENEALVSPIKSDLLSKNLSEVNQGDIDALQFDFIGLKYRRFALGYAMNFTQQINIGVTLNYLTGKGNHFQHFLVDGNEFSTDKKIDSYVANGWTDPEHKFSKITFDIGANMAIGQHFRIGAILKNYGNPTIKVGETEIQLSQRIIAGIAFRPAADLSLYMDMDIKKTDILHNGEDSQPISLGIEKGFFKNKLSIRAGFQSDLATEYFVGKKANSLFGFGFGFNMKNFLVDCAMGLDASGKVSNIALSGFFIVQ